jgi:hypothetical protein
METVYNTNILKMFEVLQPKYFFVNKFTAKNLLISKYLLSLCYKTKKHDQITKKHNEKNKKRKKRFILILCHRNVRSF